MRYQKLLTLLLLLTVTSGIFPSNSFAATAGPCDLKMRAGDVSQKSIARAIAEAKAIFQSNPRQVVIIDFPVGTFDLSQGTQGHGTIDVSGVQPGPGGWLIFRGNGASKTILTFNRRAIWIYGANAHRVAFYNMQMTADKPTVSQGHVVSVGAGKVLLDIQQGFPSPGEIFDPNYPIPSIARWIRQYTNSRTNPLMIEDNVIPVNRQIAWTSAQQVSGNRWQINFTNPKQVAPYHVGDLVGIKSKQSGNTYFFRESSDITFDHVQWRRKSRGVFRLGTSRVTISNCSIERSEAINGQAQCLSTPDGGPQIGQPDDVHTTGHRVENCHFVATGDDSVAFFRASGTISNNRIRDSFARGILRYLSPKVSVTGNEVLRCPITNML